MQCLSCKHLFVAISRFSCSNVNVACVHDCQDSGDLLKDPVNKAGRMENYKSNFIDSGTTKSRVR